MIKKLLVLAFALLVGCASALAYEPKENVVYYLGGDESGVMEFFVEACPFINPSHKAATFFHLGVTSAGGQVEPFCWARLHDGRVGIIMPAPDGSVQQMALGESDLKRGPAPKPAALPSRTGMEG